MKVYSDFLVYGPYTRKDGRQHVCLVSKTNSKVRKTVSYPKFIVESHYNRYLTIDETIDHIDKDCRNNSINNLRVLTRKEHCIIDAKRRKTVAICSQCNKEFELSTHQKSGLTRKSRSLLSGLCCSKICAGIYSSRLNKIPPIIKEDTYYTIKQNETKKTNTT